MASKYEFTGEINETGLKRIRLIRDTKWFKKGEVGGWIANESNLSHDGNCWVMENAQVYENAQIYEDAIVTNDSQILGNTRVHGKALIKNNTILKGDVEVFGDCKIYGGVWESSPLYIEGSKDAVCSSSSDTISIGCVCLSCDEWLLKVEEVAQKYGYNEIELEEYKKHIQTVIDALRSGKVKVSH